MHGLKGDDFRTVDVGLAEKLLQVLRVVVPEDELGSAAVAYSLDHRGVVAGVGVDFTA